MPAAVDAHVHVWTDDRKRYPRTPNGRESQPERFTPQDLFRHSLRSGVSRVVLIQMSFYRFDNSYMLDCIRDHPGIFSGVGIVDASAPAPDAAMKALARHGVRGFRIVPGSSPQTWLDTPGMQVMWATAAKERLAMCPLIGPDILPALDRMCRKYPETSVVIDHLARIGADGTIRDSDVAALCGLAEHRNVKSRCPRFTRSGASSRPIRTLQRSYAVYSMPTARSVSCGPAIRPSKSPKAIPTKRPLLSCAKDSHSWLRRTAIGCSAARPRLCSSLVDSSVISPLVATVLPCFATFVPRRDKAYNHFHVD
jgi:predicted TIM-barrel fold metal-dependent hydrolase